jgi:hypothetical protein
MALLIGLLVVAVIAGVAVYQTSRTFNLLSYQTYPVNADVEWTSSDGLNMMGLTKVTEGWYVTLTNAVQLVGVRVLNNYGTPTSITVTLKDPEGTITVVSQPSRVDVYTNLVSIMLPFQSSLTPKVGIYYLTVVQQGSVPEAKTEFWFKVGSIGSVAPPPVEPPVTPPDTTPPSVQITSHTEGQTVTTSTITVSGIASDNVAVSKVEVKVGGGSWQLASGTTSWNRQVSLSADPNTVYARATDTSGLSKEDQVTVYYQPPVTPPPVIPPPVEPPVTPPQPTIWDMIVQFFNNLWAWLGGH